MNPIAAYVDAQTRPNLEAGEVIKAIGYATTYSKHNRLGNPVGKAVWYLVAATDRRIILFQTPNPTGLMGVSWKPTHSSVEVWRYAELEHVSVVWKGGFLHAQKVGLVPREGCGPRWRQDVAPKYRQALSCRVLYLSQKSNGFPDQKRLASDFAPWLQRQVAAVASAGGETAPSPAAVALNTQAVSRTNPQPDAAVQLAKKSKAHLGVGCLGVVLLLAAAAFGLAADASSSSLHRSQDYIASFRAQAARDLASGYLSGTERNLALARGWQRRANDSRRDRNVLGAASCAAGFLASIAAAVAFALSRRRRARAMAT